MTDQCKSCEIHGNYKKCIKTECFHHKNWINKKQKELIRHWENEAIKANVLLDAIDRILDGKEPSDFELSFPIVLKVYDLYSGTVPVPRNDSEEG